MAYATVAGLPPVVGLCAAMTPLAVYVVAAAPPSPICWARALSSTHWSHSPPCSWRCSAPETCWPVRWFLLSAEADVEVDLTALDAVEQLRTELVSRGVAFAMARVEQDLREALDAFGLTERIGADRLFPTLATAVAAFRADPGRSAPLGDDLVP